MVQQVGADQARLSRISAQPAGQGATIDSLSSGGSSL